MCGIWLYLTTKCIDKGQLYTAFNRIKHRGPDRSRFLEFNELLTTFIGFHRLAIMDKSTAGDQPYILEYKHRSIYSLCNGEIYNHRELKDKYSLLTQSHTDTEILPYLYETLGFEGLLKEIKGEYAILIMDVDHGSGITTLYAARDPFGVRPLFYGRDGNDIAFCSELKGIHDIISVKGQFPSGSFLTCSYKGDKITDFEIKKYYSHDYPLVTPEFNDDTFKGVRERFEKAVESMLQSDRPLGALLSGGLDSSLVVSIASKYLKQHGRILRTFSIGMPGATDEKYARIVAEHCGTDHNHVEFTTKNFLDAINDIIWVTETWDVTTIRASVGQYLICKWISENTDIKVLLIGDGSDELTAGYKYFHKAPSAEELHRENARLLSEIHYFDVLRADRGVAGNGLEARVPFLSYEFVDYYMSLDPKYRMPKDGMEKWLLRRSFEGYLPSEVLYRSKEAFSDGVSGKNKSWYEIIQDNLMKTVKTTKTPGEVEAEFYRKQFNKLFGQMDHVIPHQWLPRWCGDIKEPSARVLDVYHEMI